MTRPRGIRAADRTDPRPATNADAAGSQDDGGAGRPVDGFADRVLDVVEMIPAGRVMSYGDVAEYLGEGGPRQVGRVLALWGGAVPWWRVIHADGSPPPGHERAAYARYLAEHTPLRPGTRVGAGTVRVDMRLARWHGGSGMLEP